MTKDDAVAKFDSRWWEGASPLNIVRFQLFEERLCMPFGDFHSAIEEVLGHPVWSHEFADAKRLQLEFRNRYPEVSA